MFQHDKNLYRLLDTVKTNFAKLREWFECNKLTINHTKSNFSIYHTKNRNVPQDITEIRIGDIIIKRETCVKYIGLNIDEQLNWKGHVETLIKSLVKYFGIFNNIKHFVSPKLARQLYYAFIYSRIKYGIEVYGSCSLNLKRKLQIIQNRLLKLALKRHPRTGTNELHSQIKILKVEDIYKYSLSLFVHDCLHSNCPPPLEGYFTRRQTVHNTRQTGSLEIKRCRTNLGKTQVKYKAANLWNTLGDIMKNTQCRNTLKKPIKNNFLDHY